jgi:hypothetical protein
MPTHRIYQLRYVAAHTSLALACALLWQTSAAQTPLVATTANASNPAAQVPAVQYRSVFQETSLGVEKDSTDWRKANDEVGKFTRGHIDILKWEEQEAAKAMKGSMDKPMDKAMEKPVAEPDTMKKPATPSTPDTTKPIAAPAHKH